MRHCGSFSKNISIVFIFRPGRKLATVRKRVELEILQECGGRSDIYSYYQCPLLNHYSSSLYPPLYTRNIEKEVSETSIGYAQISVSSLWSIIFKQTSAGYHSASEEIDVKSCVLSLIDLYNHWLNQPLHIVVINHIFQSIVMLSDLFTVVSINFRHCYCFIHGFAQYTYITVEPIQMDVAALSGLL